jgi:hypothetical protein
VATTISDATLLNSRFDIFQFPFRFNPGTNRGNVEMGLINKSYLVTLNQRVPGLSPGAPTNKINSFWHIDAELETIVSALCPH